VTVENSTLGNTPTSSAINVVLRDRWHILYNRIHDTGDSGILTQSGEEEVDKPGDSFVIEGNVIENTGTDGAISYPKHGIYLKVRHARVIGNTITNLVPPGGRACPAAWLGNRRVRPGLRGRAAGRFVRGDEDRQRGEIRPAPRGPVAKRLDRPLCFYLTAFPGRVDRAHEVEVR
jgi:hypothetical protein